MRFPEYTDEWKTVRLGDISKIQRGASPRPISSKKWYDTLNKKVGWVRISDLTRSSKFLYETEDYLSEAGINKSRFLPKGSLIMSICATIGKPIITSIDTCIHDGFVGFSKLDNVDKEFLYYYLKKLEPKFNSLSQTGSQANLNSDLVKITKITIPSLNEQKKISAFISSIDVKLKLLKDKKDEYVKFKHYLLQNLFPQNGETVPKLRFNKFHDEWTTSILGNFSEINTGDKDLKDKSEKGKYPFFVRSKKIERINSYSYNGEAILIPGDGKIGQIFHYINGKFDYHQRVYKISDFKNVNGKYIYYYLQKFFLKHALKYSVKATVDSLRLPIIKEMEIKFPSLKEQEKIASFLSAIDQKIDLLDQEIEYVEEYKKGLLQKMFIWRVYLFYCCILSSEYLEIMFYIMIFFLRYVLLTLVSDLMSHIF